MRFVHVLCYPLIYSILPTILLMGCTAQTETIGPRIALSTDALDFGDVPSGTSSTLEFKVSNVGDDVLELHSITLIKGTPFALTWDHASTLEPGDSVAVSVAFAPDAVREYDDDVQVRSNDPEHSPWLVSLTGTGTLSTLDEDGDGASVAEGDCDDADPSRFPGNPEICDGRDNDCDGTLPADESDEDRDGYRPCDGDCDDENADTYPGALEICDDEDNDCDGFETDRTDVDGDGYSICGYEGSGTGIDAADCDDSNPDASPALEESCGDAVDNDCDGKIDNIDEDGDGFSLCDPIADCDDTDARVHPLFVSPEGAADAPGTVDAPLDGLENAIALLGDSCRTIYLFSGRYEVSLVLDGLPAFSIEGESRDETLLEASEESRHISLLSGSLEMKRLTVVEGMAGGEEEGNNGGALFIQDADLTLTKVSFSSNTAEGDGGAIAVRSGTLSITQSSFDGNSAGDGGALSVKSGTLTLDRTSFYNNLALNDGGALSVVGGILSDEAGEYIGNSAVDGGALNLQSSSLSLRGVLIESNFASGSGGGIAILDAPEVLIEQSRLWSNSATQMGGGIFMDSVEDEEGTLRGSLIQDNVAGDAGGGLCFIDTGGLDILNNTLNNNSASAEGGGLAVLRDDGVDSGLRIRSNIVAWSGGDSGLYNGDESSLLEYNLVYFSEEGVNFDGFFSLDEAFGNLEMDPRFTLFVDDSEPENDDLTLQSESPAIDSGPEDSALNDKDGTRNDRGAYGGPYAME